MMRVNYNEYNFILHKFLVFIEKQEIINDYIKDCGEPSYNVNDAIDEVKKSHGRKRFNIGDTEKEEVANIYHILKYCSENNIVIAYNIARSYSNATNWQDKIKAFNERVTMVLIRYIEGYLTKIGFDMGVDEHTRHSITVNNGQVNVALDSSTIHAVQNYSINTQQLTKLINVIRGEITSLPSEDSEAVKENLEVIESELAQPKPRKNFLKTALNGLRAIKGSTEFLAAVAQLVSFIQPFID